MFGCVESSLCCINVVSESGGKLREREICLATVLRNDVQIVSYKQNARVFTCFGCIYCRTMAEIPTHLLLLSFPPWPPSPETLHQRYHSALTAVLKQLSDHIRVATVGTCLDIVLPLSVFHSFPDAPRATLFPQVQALVAGVYKLVCIVAARESINVEDAEGIDVRVLLMAHPDAQNWDSLPAKVSCSLGPVVSLKMLVESHREWRSVYAVEGEEGDRLLREFTTSQDGRVKIQRVPGDSSSTAVNHLPQEPAAGKHYTSIAVGGTWDHIHIGHKLLLTMFAFIVQTRQDHQAVLTVGITGDELLRTKKFGDLLESWHDRQLAARNFLCHIIDFRPLHERLIKEQEISNPGPNGHTVLYEIGDKFLFNLVEISDPFGPTITDETIDALVLSAETRAGGKAINEKRMEAGWDPLEVFEVDVLDASEQQASSVDGSFQSKLSSTAIRQALSERGQQRSKA